MVVHIRNKEADMDKDGRIATSVVNPCERSIIGESRARITGREREEETGREDQGRQRRDEKYGRSTAETGR